MFELTCNYCNFQWTQEYVNRAYISCGKCKDSNIKVVDVKREKVDYYAGSPPFPEEEEENVGNKIFELYDNLGF